jgi:hypothetical protein
MMQNVPGALAIYLMFAVVLTIPISLTIIALYRRAVREEMVRVGPSTQAGTSSPPQVRDLLALPCRYDPTALLQARLVIVFGLAALAWSAVSAGLEVLADGSGWGAFLFRMCVLIWPLAPALSLLLALPVRWSLAFSLALWLAGISIIFAWSVFAKVVLGHASAPFTQVVLDYSFYLVLEAGVPYLFIVLTSNRKLRPVSPLVLAGLLVFSFGYFGTKLLVMRALDFTQLRDILFALKQPPDLVGWMMTSLPIGVLCWLLLRWLARAFESKAFSDVQLVVDLWWLIATSSVCVTLSLRWSWQGMIGLVAFAAYRAVVSLGFFLWRIDGAVPGPRRLLLLRVFGYQRRTEALLDHLGQRWRFNGNVNILAGADLAGRTVDPGEMVSYLSGSFQSIYVRDSEELRRRLDRLDERRDPDGRFRVNDFFCYEGTWRETLEALLWRSDAVLMDLRGFTEGNSGCIFELEKLVELACLERTLFIVDDRTNVGLLRETLMAASNRQNRAQPTIRLATMQKHSGRELQGVLTTLYQQTSGQFAPLVGHQAY